MDQSFEYKTLDRTHATLHESIDPALIHGSTMEQQPHKVPMEYELKRVNGSLDRTHTTLHGSLPVLFTGKSTGKILESFVI